VFHSLLIFIEVQIQADLEVKAEMKQQNIDYLLLDR
jgi:hypothetical protein